MSGIAPSALAVLAPMKTSSEEPLRAALEALGDGDHGPFASVPGTHFGRFAFVRRLTDEHGDDVEDLGPFLLMCADFDAPIESWTAELCGRAGGQLDSVMSFCDGWPGSGEPGAVGEFFVRHNAAPGFTVAGYRRATVEKVRDTLALRGSLRELAVRAANEGLEGAALRRAWREAVGA